MKGEKLFKEDVVSRYRGYISQNYRLLNELIQILEEIECEFLPSIRKAISEASELNAKLDKLVNSNRT